MAKIEREKRKMDFIEVLDIFKALGLDPCDLIKELANYLTVSEFLLCEWSKHLQRQLDGPTPPTCVSNLAYSRDRLRDKIASVRSR